MEGIINLHHDLMFFIVFIFFFVSVVLGRTLQIFAYSKERQNDPQTQSYLCLREGTDTHAAEVSLNGSPTVSPTTAAA
jgi:heme/copper-type cytochrome/quinol oxidase subunit 2